MLAPSQPRAAPVLRAAVRPAGPRAAALGRGRHPRVRTVRTVTAALAVPELPDNAVFGLIPLTFVGLAGIGARRIEAREAEVRQKLQAAGVDEAEINEDDFAVASTRLGLLQGRLRAYEAAGAAGVEEEISKQCAKDKRVRFARAGPRDSEAREVSTGISRRAHAYCSAGSPSLSDPCFIHTMLTPTLIAKHQGRAIQIHGGVGGEAHGRCGQGPPTLRQDGSRVGGAGGRTVTRQCAAARKQRRGRGSI